MKRLRKLIANIFLATSVLALNPTEANAEWKYDKNGSWYTEGDSYATGWRLINGYWYYFYSNGYAAEGWQKLNGNWYYFGYGYMHSNTIIDGYYLDSNGVWSNAAKEVTEYSKKIEEIKYNKKINNTSLMEYNLVADIDNDGVMEAIELNGESEMSKQVTVFDYYDNSVHTVDSIYSPRGFIKGYNTAKQEFAISLSGQGEYWGEIYKLEKNKCEKVGTYYSGTHTTNTYKIDDNVVSKEKFDEFMSDFKH